jgi:hypothetical protein
MNDDDAPPSVKKLHELAALLLLTENPEARAVLTEFLRVCEHPTQEQLVEVLAMFGA